VLAAAVTLGCTPSGVIMPDAETQDPFGKKVNCLVPSKVADRDYPSDSIQYVFLLHSHPYDTPISEDDILFLEREGERHRLRADPCRRLA